MRGLFGQRGLIPVADTDGIAGQWHDLLLGDITATWVNNDATMSATDTGGGYMTLAANDDGSSVADYPSRMRSIAWALPTGVEVFGPGGWGVVFRLLLDTQPADGTAFNVGIGLSDGDPATGATVALIGGIRYAAVNPRLYASSRGGGGADVESSAVTVPATIGQLVVQVSANEIALNQVDVYALSADASESGDHVVTKQVTSAHAGNLRIMLSWGRDSIAAGGSVSLRVRPQALWFRMPA